MLRQTYRDSYLDVLLHLTYNVFNCIVGLLNGCRTIRHSGQGISVELLFL